MSEHPDKPAYAVGGYTGSRWGVPPHFDDGCYIPINPAFTHSSPTNALASLPGCIVGWHRFAWLATGGAECIDCGAHM